MIANNPNIDVYYYSVRQPDGFGWGHFYISSTGMVACYSDYENTVYRWTNFGDGDFRRWFVECIDNGEKSYVLNKFFPAHRHEVIDGKASVNNIKRTILAWVRDGSWSKFAARTEWDLMEEYNLEHDDSKECWGQWTMNTNLDDAYEYIHYDYPASVHDFWDALMPLLSIEIHKEIDGVVE